MKISMIKCDRCGLLYNEHNKCLNLTIYHNPEDFSDYDLCTKCSELLLSFIDDNPILSEKQIIEEPVKSCEEKCYDKIVAVKDFKRCHDCALKGNCPARNDSRCSKEDPCDDIIDLCEEVYENLPKDKAEPKPFDQNGKYYTWNEKEINFLYNNYKEMSVIEMAESLGRSANSVYGKMTKLGLKSNKKRRSHGRRPFEKWEIDYIQDNHNLMTIEELADVFGRAVTSVTTKLKELGLEAKKGE